MSIFKSWFEFPKNLTYLFFQKSFFEAYFIFSLQPLSLRSHYLPQMSYSLLYFHKFISLLGTKIAKQSSVNRCQKRRFSMHGYYNECFFIRPGCSHILFYILDYSLQDKNKHIHFVQFSHNSPQPKFQNNNLKYFKMHWNVLIYLFSC